MAHRDLPAVRAAEARPRRAAWGAGLGARAHSPAAGRSPRCARGSGAARRAAAGGVPGAHPGVLQVVRLRTASVGGCRKGRGAGPHLPRAWGPEGTGRRRVEVRAPWRLARSGCPTDHDEGHPRRRPTHDAAHPRRRRTHEQGRAGRGACRRAVRVGPGETRSACGKRGGVHGQRLDPRDLVKETAPRLPQGKQEMPRSRVPPPHTRAFPEPDTEDRVQSAPRLRTADRR